VVHGLSLATITGRSLGKTPFVQVSTTWATSPDTNYNRSLQWCIAGSAPSTHCMMDSSGLGATTVWDRKQPVRYRRGISLCTMMQGHYSLQCIDMPPCGPLYANIHPQNRKYITHCNAANGGSSHSHRFRTYHKNSVLVGAISGLGTVVCICKPINK